MRRREGIYTAGALIAVVCCLGALKARGQQGAAVRAQADSSGIRIGEQFHVVLDATVDTSLGRIEWAQVPDTFDHVLVVDRSAIDTVAAAGGLHYQQRLTLTSFDSGQWMIPAFTFHVLPAGGTDSAQALQTESLSIYVNTVPVDTTKPFRPIKPIRQVPFRLWDYWPFMLGGLVLLALLVWLIFFRRRKTKEKPAAPRPGEPPYVVAEKDLHALEAEKLWQQGQVKAYYTRLTDILRLYIEKQFQVNALEQTTDELLSNIRPVTRLNQQRAPLQRILETADLAKFAKLQPLAEDHETCLRLAYDFVAWTRPRPEATGDKAADDRGPAKDAPHSDSKT